MLPTVTKKFSFSPALTGAGNNAVAQCAEVPLAILKPPLPQYTPLVSGLSVSGTVPCTALGPLSYTYYALSGPLKSISFAIQAHYSVCISI